MQEGRHSNAHEQSNTPGGVQTRIQQRLVVLQRQVAQAASKASEAKQKRRTLLADISSCTRKSALFQSLLMQQSDQHCDLHRTLNMGSLLPGINRDWVQMWHLLLCRGAGRGDRSRGGGGGGRGF